MAKYKPKLGDKIEFYRNKAKHTGMIVWMGDKTVSVYPHTLVLKDRHGKVMDCEWFVEPSELIGRVKDANV